MPRVSLRCFPPGGEISHHQHDKKQHNKQSVHINYNLIPTMYKEAAAGQSILEGKLRWQNGGERELTDRKRLEKALVRSLQLMIQRPAISIQQQRTGR